VTSLSMIVNTIIDPKTIASNKPDTGTESKFCIECGSKLKLKSKFCTKCGTEQVEV
jgi:predicted amidophosphoribosyltransferase